MYEQVFVLASFLCVSKYDICPENEIQQIENNFDEAVEDQEKRKEMS